MWVSSTCQFRVIIGLTSEMSTLMEPIYLIIPPPPLLLPLAWPFVQAGDNPFMGIPSRSSSHCIITTDASSLHGGNLGGRGGDW